MKHRDFPWSFGGFLPSFSLGFFVVEVVSVEEDPHLSDVGTDIWGEKGREEVGKKDGKRWDIGMYTLHTLYIYICIFFFRTGENPRRTGFWNFLEESGKERTI